jgi:hypothetical protein
MSLCEERQYHPFRLASEHIKVAEQSFQKKYWVLARYHYAAAVDELVNMPVPDKQLLRNCLQRQSLCHLNLLEFMPAIACYLRSVSLPEAESSTMSNEQRYLLESIRQARRIRLQDNLSDYTPRCTGQHF